MGSNISANTLFHFTRGPEKLINILIDGFYPRCCMENLGFIYGQGSKQLATTGFAIPMVCFCDIPLSQIRNHVEKYGGYALGLSKEWGENNGINPVMYELPDSNAVNTIRKSILATIPFIIDENPHNEAHANKLKELGNQLIFFSCYLKPYKGQRWDGEGFSGEDIIFYDEKEWRYIPEYGKIIERSFKPYIFSHDYLDGNKKDDFNEIFRQHFKLVFKPEDIKYIIVDKEIEVLSMAKMVENIKNNFNDDEVKLLITKIISIERLRDDF